MDISSFGAAAPGESQKSRIKAQSGADTATQAFQKADKRVQQQRDVVSVQLSSFGQLKSAVADTQLAARAVSDSKQTATDADIRKVANNFVKAFNTAVQTAKAATAAQGALADNNRARAVVSDLRRAVGNDETTAADLKKIGITQQRNGTLAIDAKKFDAALKAEPEALRGALAEIGQTVDRTATRELANNGNIGGAVSSLANRARNLENQQADQQAQAAAAQQLVNAASTGLNNSLNTGVLAYQRIFSI